MRAMSIRVRLTASYAAIFALTFVVAGVGALLALQGSITTSADADLRARVRAARDYLALAPRVVDQHLIDGLGEHAGSGGFGTYLRIAGPDGKWLFRSPATARWPAALPERRALPEDGEAVTLNVDGSRMRILSAPMSIGIVQIGFPLDEFDRLMRRFAWFIGLGSPVLLTLAGLGGYWISGRALRAVDDIATAARRIGAANLSERLPSRG